MTSSNLDGNQIAALIDAIKRIDSITMINQAVRHQKAKLLAEYNLKVVDGEVSHIDKKLAKETQAIYLSKADPVVRPRVTEEEEAKKEVVPQPEKGTEVQSELPKTAIPSAAQTVSEDVQNAVLNNLSGQAN